MAEPTQPPTSRQLFWRDIAVVGYGLTLALLLAAGVLGYRNASRLASHERWVEHTQQNLVQLEALLSSLKDAETGQRGYLLLGEERYLTPYERAVQTLPRQLAGLGRVLSDNPAQQARLAETERLLAARLDLMRRTVDLARAGDIPRAVDLVRGGEGLRLMGELRRSISALQEAEQSLLRDRTADAERSFRAVVWTFLLTTGIGSLLVSCVFFLTQRNVRLRRRAAATIADQKERLRITLASIGDGVVSTDAAGRVTALNAVAEELTGWTQENAAGQPLETVFQIVNEETRKPVENPTTRALRDGVIVGLANHTILIARDGTERFIDDSAAPIRSTEGEIVGCVLIFRDISEKRRGELGLQADLIEMTRLQALSAANEAALRDSNRRQNEFLAMLAHELRNPLAPIRSALEVIKRAWNDREMVSQATAMMERQVSQMVRFVDDLLDVSRISRGKIELRKGTIELASAVNHAVEAARPLCETLGNELEVFLSSEALYLNADPARISQVVGNLLNNACKFTNRGGKISLFVERDGDQAVIRVLDTGIGIAPEQLSRIFDLFMQVDTSLERSVSGLGIGLKLVKTLIELHDGTVEARSDGLGLGSEFVVRLPLTAAPLAPEPPAAAVTRAPLPRRVLVIDDNRDAAVSLARLLKLKGHEAHTANDGLEALEMARDLRPELVLCDIGLPKLNGYEVAKRIREQDWGKGAVLLAVTGWGQEEFRQRSKAAGFDGHLVKPVDFEAFDQLLASFDGNA